MGLDMFVHKFAPGSTDGEELMYWRKHHDMHGWMFRLAQTKGFTGGPENFNCVDVQLEAADLDLLEEDVKNYNLPHTEGFFFGNNPPDAESVQQDLEFIANARLALAEGYTLAYGSWW